MTNRPLQSPPRHVPKISPLEARIFSDLRKVHLRHSGLVKPNITRLFHRDEVTYQELLAAKMEWLRLGFSEAQLKVVPTPPSAGGAA